MYATSYLLKLQTDHVILDGDGQACPGLLKEAFEIYISQTVGVPKLIFGHLSLGESDYSKLCIDF